MKKNNNSNNSRSKGQTPMAKTAHRDRNRSKSSSNQKEVGAKLSSKGRDNDPNWYFSNPQLAEQASELSFQSFIGEGGIYGGYSVPSIMVAALNPCPGNSYGVNVSNNGDYDADLPDSTDRTGLNSGFNLMSSKIYTLLSTYSGRSSSYTPDDVGIMILAVSAMAEMSEYIRRAFGVILTYNDRNRTVPLGLIKAMGIDASDLLANIANYRMRFNIAINRINQIPLLDNIGFIKKSRDLYQRIYLDAPTSMAQILMYVPQTTWVLHEDDYTKGSHLKTRFIISNNVTQMGPDGGLGYNTWTVKTMGDLLDILEEQIEALLTSSTLNIVYADLINLASKTSVPVWKFDYLAENYVVIPEYNRNFLLQFHNLDLVGYPVQWNGTGDAGLVKTVSGYTFTVGNDVVGDVDTGRVIYNPGTSRIVTSGGNYWGIFPTQSVIDLDTDAPSVEDRIEALRFSSLPSGYYINGLAGAGVYNEAFRALPDHYASSLNIFDGNGNVTVIGFNMFRRNLAASDVNMLGLMSQINWHPFILSGPFSTSKKFDSTGIALHGDLNFWTEVDYMYLVRLNKLMYTGLFDFRV